jgi:hypothetical protein
VAKKTTRKPTPKPEGTAPAAEERTGEAVPDVRVSIREIEDGRHVRLCLRRGGAPVALTPDQAREIAEELMTSANDCR